MHARQCIELSMYGRAALASSCTYVDAAPGSICRVGVSTTHGPETGEAEVAEATQSAGDSEGPAGLDRML